MTRYRFAIYDAFSAHAFGGSQAAVIENTGAIDTGLRRKIAREFGLPATAFVDDTGDGWVQAQFMSTVMELPMCGHGTICLFTHLLESGQLSLAGEQTLDVNLRLPKTSANVELGPHGASRYRVMLDIEPPAFVAPPPHIGRLLTLLGLDADALDADLPLETARGDFIHLVVPLGGLAAMRAIKPNFNGMVEFCNANGIETIAVFCREVENPASTIHVRDFCPAVGVSESAAAGTTNAALTAYLLRHGLAPADGDRSSLYAEQGLELGRPSQIQSVVSLADGEITRLQVGGVATRVFDGQVYF